MAKPSAQSALYRLIEAGQLARRALAAPLLERGLEAGDDAVLFLLTGGPVAVVDLAEAAGLPVHALEMRLDRLVGRGLLQRDTGVASVALTEAGERLRVVLAGNWEQLEAALFGDLTDKRRKHLDKALKRFTQLLRL